MYKHKFLIFSFSSEEEKVQQAMKQYRNRIIWRRETGRKKAQEKNCRQHTRFESVYTNWKYDSTSLTDGKKK